ncbi:MAG: hypothetical protein KGH69_02045 [Candidatus Micrarchaeota archaeon]|nr:hypothetical protein [Candidatus Micrarchaeota archaeon]
MDAKAYTKAIAILAVAGVVFSGYLTAYTYASGRPGCEVFYFGLPSCLYGFIMYLLIFTLSTLLFIAKKGTRAVAMAVIALAGMAFSAYLTLAIMNNTSCTTFDILGQPPCVYGLAMYLVLLLVAISVLWQRKS